MIRYTTPTMTFRVVGEDITTYDVVVTLSQRFGCASAPTTLDIEAADLTLALDGSDTLVTFDLTQAQTGGFRDGAVEVQVNYGSGSLRGATEIKELAVVRNLHTGVLAFDVSSDPNVPEDPIDLTPDAPIAYVTVPDGAVTTTKLADGAVTNDKLASTAIPTMSASTKGIAKVGAGLAMNGEALELDGNGNIATAVSSWLDAHPEATTTVQDGAITTAKLADGAVSDAKLAQTGGVLDGVASLAGILDSGAAPASFSFENGYINPSTGQNMALSGFVRTVGYIRLVGKLLSVTVPDGFEIIVFNYDDSNGFIDYYSWWSGTVTKYDMGDIGFVRIAARSTTSTPITVSDMDNLVITMESRDILSLQGQINETNAAVDEFGVTHVNLFDKSARAEGYVVGGDGALSPNASFFASDFIDVSSYESVVLSWTHITHFYTADKSNISLSDTYPSLSSDVRVQVPQGAKYLRFSTYNENLDRAQVGPHVSRANYVPYSHYYLPDLRQDNNAIIVDAAGNGDYTSFTKAVYDNLDTGVPIVVMAGTYDIKAEYVALFGQSVVDALSDSTTGINGFQYGIVLRNRRIEFECGSRLVCDWTGLTIDSTHRFSALMVGYNVEIVGLDIDCTKTWYVIHDDQAPSDNSSFTTTYRNCRVIGHSIVNANCIGGGCHKFSRHVLENCYFDNGVHTYGNPDVRYHNTAVAGAKPEVFVANCYFATGLTLSYYGTQTEKMRAYVNNCYARHGINKVPETADSTVDNVDVYKWNNVESA